MPYPTAVVEIAFTDGPYVVSPTWIDVTPYVREMQISRGVSDDWQLVADGLATVVLSNRDRRFDPFNITGPYYGNLLPRRQIRIRATYSGTTYDVFRGFISGWPPEWTDAGYDSTVTLSCFDALQLLGSSSLPADWSRAYILSTSPRHYYPCDEPITSYTAQSLRDLGSNPLEMFILQDTVQGAELAQGLPSRSVNPLAGGWVTTANQVANYSSDFTVSTWAIFDTGGAASWAFGNHSISLSFDQTTQKYVATYFDGALAITRRATTNNTFDGSVERMISASVNVTSKAITVWVNGVAQATTVVNTGGLIYIPGESVSLGAGQYQQVIGWLGLQSTAAIQQIFNLSTAYFPETTSARIDRIIAETPFSGSLVSKPASPASSVLEITNGSPTVSSELAKVAESEYAPLFVNKTGTLTQYQQNQIRTQTKSIVSQATYGSGGLPIGTDVQLQYDGDSMRNIANIQMSGGGVYIQEATNISTYGEAEQYVGTQVSSLADAVDIANIVDGWGSQVYAKASPVQVVLSPHANWASTLGLELWDRFTLVVQPRTGSAITRAMLASRISHSVTPERWNTTLEGSARWAAVFILNQSTLGGTDLLG